MKKPPKPGSCASTRNISSCSPRTPSPATACAIRADASVRGTRNSGRECTGPVGESSTAQLVNATRVAARNGIESRPRTRKLPPRRRCRVPVPGEPALTLNPYAPLYHVHFVSRDVVFLSPVASATNRRTATAGDAHNEVLVKFTDVRFRKRTNAAARGWSSDRRPFYHPPALRAQLEENVDSVLIHLTCNQIR